MTTRRQPSWEQIAHLLASRVFPGSCPHRDLDPECPFCQDTAAVQSYRDKCAATGRRYAGQDFDEAMAAAPIIEVHAISRRPLPTE